MIHRLYHGLDQADKLPPEPLEHVVIRVFQQIVVQVADEMDKAFLLRAINGIIRRVKIRHQNSREILEHRLNGAAFPRWSIEICNLLHTRKDPYIPVSSLDAYTRFVDMQQTTTAKPFQNTLICAAVGFSSLHLEFVP